MAPIRNVVPEWRDVDAAVECASMDVVQQTPQKVLVGRVYPHWWQNQGLPRVVDLMRLIYQNCSFRKPHGSYHSRVAGVTSRATGLVIAELGVHKGIDCGGIRYVTFFGNLRLLSCSY